MGPTTRTRIRTNQGGVNATNCTSTIRLSKDDKRFSRHVLIRLGVVLLQESGQDWQPVAYASHAKSETERRYTQVEKEALAVTWVCGKFFQYLLGKKFHIESDHKSLIPLLSSKNLYCLPLRIIHFRL